MPETMTLIQRFRFYRERNPAPLAYFFARRKHAAQYAVPEWIAMLMWQPGETRRGC